MGAAETDEERVQLEKEWGKLGLHCCFNEERLPQYKRRYYPFTVVKRMSVKTIEA